MSQKFRANVDDSKFGLAIVTGGSSGIGKSIIEQLLTLEPALLIFNLSRRKPAPFSIDSNVRHLECDLSDRAGRQMAFDQLEQEIEQSCAAGKMLLINNAGYGLYGRVEDQPPADHLALLEVNILALVELSARILPSIKQRGGSIMNIASTTALQPTPGLATYGASKAFVLNWTLALNHELRGSTAHAIAVCPGPTSTDFFRRAGLSGAGKPPGMSQSPEHVARLAMKALRKRKSIIVCGALNRLASTLCRLLPISLQTGASAWVIRRLRTGNKSSS